MPRKTLPLRLSDEERAPLDRAAERVGLKLAPWIRMVAKKAAAESDAQAAVQKPSGLA